MTDGAYFYYFIDKSKFILIPSTCATTYQCHSQSLFNATSINATTRVVYVVLTADCFLVRAVVIY